MTTTKALVLVLLSGLLAGCVSSNPEFHTYRVVSHSNFEIAADSGSLPTSIGVFPVTVAGWLDKKHVVWSDGGVQVQISSIDRWGEPLPQLMTQAMVQNLQTITGFEVWVSSGPWARSQRPEVIIRISVDSIVIDGSQLNLTADWMLENRQGDKLAHKHAVYQQAYNGTEPDAAYVDALSRAWGQVATDIMQSMVAGSSDS